MSETQEATILYQHYSESASLLRSLLRRRLQNAWMVLGLVGLLAASGVDKAGATSVLKRLSLSGFEFDLAALDPHFVNSFLWLAFAGTVMLLYHKSYVIEFQADYLRDLEKRLVEALQGLQIDLQRRERPRELKYAANFTFGMYGTLLFVITVAKIGLEIWYLGAVIRRGELFPAGLFVGLDCVVFVILCRQTYLFSQWLGEQASGDNATRRAETQEHVNTKS